VPNLFSRFFVDQRDLRQLRREVAALRRENEELRGRNASMREGMRRCVTCDYRLDYKARQGEAPIKIQN
jgi:cell division protein FtsB